MCGAVVGATTGIRVGTALIHQGTRHPLTIAAMAATLQSMSEGRFLLGMGRGLAALAPSLGVGKATLASLEHTASILRRLWAGERISEEGPAGSFRKLRFADVPEASPPPMYLGTIGPKGMALAGRVFDGVILHPFLTVEAVARSAAIVREAASEAGRDPQAIRIVSTLVTAPDLSEARTDLAVRARAVSYFQVRSLGEQLVERNGWDQSVLAGIRSHPTMAGAGIADTAMPRDRLVDAAEAMPEEWFAQGAAIGSSSHCAQRVAAYLGAGADEVLLHGASPAESAGVVRAFTRLP